MLVCYFVIKNTLFQDVLLALSSGLLSGAILAFFFERKSNNSKIDELINNYNQDISQLYKSLASLSGYTYLKDFITSNYALNDYCQEMGININPENINEYYNMLIQGVLKKFDNDVDKIPGADSILRMYVNEFLSHLGDIDQKLDLFSSKNRNLISDNLLTELQKYSSKLAEFKKYMMQCRDHVFKPQSSHFDEMLKWAKDNATADFLTSKYMI